MTERHSMPVLRFRSLGDLSRKSGISCFAVRLCSLGQCLDNEFLGQSFSSSAHEPSRLVWVLAAPKRNEQLVVITDPRDRLDLAMALNIETRGQKGKYSTSLSWVGI